VLGIEPAPCVLSFVGKTNRERQLVHAQIPVVLLMLLQHGVMWLTCHTSHAVLPHMQDYAAAAATADFKPKALRLSLLLILVDCPPL
jgi:hypothetical protein